MKPRRLFTLLSLLLLPPTLLFWIIGRTHALSLNYTAADKTTYFLSTNPGALLIGSRTTSTLRVPDGFQLIFGRWGSLTKWSSPTITSSYTLTTFQPRWSLLGLWAGHNHYNSWPWAPPKSPWGFQTPSPQGFTIDTTGLLLPLWLPSLLFTIPPLFHSLDHRRKITRSRQGLCPTCGYDLRSSPNTCPECGAAPIR